MLVLVNMATNAASATTWKPIRIRYFWMMLISLSTFKKPVIVFSVDLMLENAEAG